MSDDAADELDELLRASLSGSLSAEDAVKLRDAVTQLRARLRGEGSLQTRYKRTLTQLRQAREALAGVRDLAESWERTGDHVTTHMPTMVHALQVLASQGEAPVRGGSPDVEGCPFCDIVTGRGPAEVLQTWPDTLVIKPLRPVTEGHVLVIPRSHVTSFSEDPVITGVTMRHAARYAARSVHGAVNLITSRGEAASQSVFHLHVHLVPRVWNDGLALPWHSGRMPDWAARAAVNRERHELGTPMTALQAAQALNCSVAFVMMLIRQGELRVHQMNGDQVIFNTEVLTYKERDDARRREAASELTRLNEELS